MKKYGVYSENLVYYEFWSTLTFINDLENGSFDYQRSLYFCWRSSYIFFPKSQSQTHVEVEKKGG